MTNGKTIALTIQTFVSKIISLLFNMLSRFVITFFQFVAAVTICSDFGAQENKVSHCFHFFRIYLSWSDGTGCQDLCFLNVELLSQLFCSPLSLSSRGSLVPSHFLPWGWCHLHIWGYWYFSWQLSFQFVLHPVWHFTWCILHRS